MKTAEEIRRELEDGPNIVKLKPKREPSYLDHAVSARDLDAKVFPPTKFVVQDLLPVGLAVLSAAPKVGKTWFDLKMSDDVAAGRPFGGCKPVDQGEVLALDLENNERRSQLRLKRIRQGEEVPQGLMVANTWRVWTRAGSTSSGNGRTPAGPPAKSRASSSSTFG
jgi:RecA-family ATPase